MSLYLFILCWYVLFLLANKNGIDYGGPTALFGNCPHPSYTELILATKVRKYVFQIKCKVYCANF